MVLTAAGVRGTQFRGAQFRGAGAGASAGAGAGDFFAYIINCAYIILADPRI